MAFDLVIDIVNKPLALARLAVTISDAGVNIAAAHASARASAPATHPRAACRAAKHALASSGVAISREVVAGEVRGPSRSAGGSDP
jgi:hypothetical protein